MRLADKVALVTGAGSGIGRAASVLFATEGARVVVSDLKPAHVNETVEQVTSAGGEVVSVAGDVSDASDARQMVETAVETYGKLDVLVNSAGVSSRNALGPGASPEEVWDRVIAVNLKGTYLPSWYAVPEMERSGGGSIVNLASIIGLVAYNAERGLPFDPYPPSKGGVVQFTRNLV